MSQYKTCSKCNRSLSFNEFGKDRYKSSGLTSQCKSCRNAHKRLTRLDPAVRENHRQKSKAYYHANKSRMAQNYKKWVVANPQKRKESNRKSQIKRRDKHAAYMRQYRIDKPEMRREWAIKNPEKQRALYSERSSRKRASAIYKVQSAELIALRTMPCIYCGSRREIQIEHIIPLARGGEHKIGNLAPACRACNMSKKDKFVMEWKIANKKTGLTSERKR